MAETPDRDRSTPEKMDLFPNGEVGIVWKDGHESIYRGHYLRCQCRCAACIDEVTGRRILDERSVPEDVQARIYQGIGHYGVQFVWSDGHSTGIYPLTLLRDLCPCAACAPALPHPS